MRLYERTGAGGYYKSKSACGGRKPLRVFCCASSAVGGAHLDDELYCRPGNVYSVVLGLESVVIWGQW